MAAMTVQKVVDAGTVPTLSAVNANDTAAVGNGTNCFLWLKNTAGTTVTVTITEFFVLDNGSTAQNAVITLAATTGQAFVPLRRSYDKGDGTGAQIAYTGTTIANTTSALVQVGG